MQYNYRAIEYLIKIGPVMIMPVILFIAGLFSPKNILNNLKNCLYIFLGMLGIAVFLTMFVNFFEPLNSTILINSAKDYTIIDTGWGVSGTVAFNSPVIPYIIIAVIGLNILMLLFRLTRTINLDLWGYWSFLLAGSIIFAITGVGWMAVLFSVIVAAITFVFADIYAHHIEEYYGIKGISNTQSHIICWAPISHLVNIAINKITFMKRVHLFYEEIQYRLGLFSEPMISGFMLGFILGLLTRFKTLIVDPGPDLIFALKSGLRFSIIMILLPRAVNLMLKGLVPQVNDITGMIKNRFTERTIYIGLDSIVLVGHPSVIGLSAVLIPLTVYISTILPGSKVLPAADLIMIPFIAVWAVTLSRGDLFRGFISSLIVIPILLWITTDMGQVFTSFFTRYEYALAEGYSSISSIGASSNVFLWILLQIIRPIMNFFL